MNRAGSKPGAPVLFPVLLFAAALALHAASVAPATLFGDPAEYQFIPAIAGIAHPPGYAFYILLARAWQTLVPVGSIALRTNLLSSAVGAWVVTAVYLIARDVGPSTERHSGRAAKAEGRDGTDQRTSGAARWLVIEPAPLLAAISLAVAPDHWQHAIHANAHIVSAALAVTHLWLLVRWWRTGRDRWLFAFALALGLAASHHPITLIGLPAYGLFVLVARPRILRQWRTLLVLAGCVLLGLAPLLYYPLRSPTAPFGPTDMRTWEGFWRHVTAKGLRVNLFHFGLAEQLHRALVFWSLLRLQFPLPLILLVPIGVAYLIRRAPRLTLLFIPFLLGHLAFTLNTVQDVMAYLLLPFAALAVTVGIGAQAIVGYLRQAATRLWPKTGRLRLTSGNLVVIVCHLSLIALPIFRAATNLQRGISLRDFTAAEDYVAAVHRRFDGTGEGAVLLSDWEHLTPLWVHAYTTDEQLDEADVRLIYVSTSNPWVESVWAHIEDGPIYLPDYRPSVRNEGFRLVPEGDFWRVLAPPVTGTAPSHRLDAWAGDRVHVLGYDLPATTVRSGDQLTLVLYQSTPVSLADIWMPYAQLGPIEVRWTTDSRLLTTQWMPDEEVVERYEIPIPFTLPPGAYPLRLGYTDLTGTGADLAFANGELTVPLATITVLPNAAASRADVLQAALANLDNQIALTGARVRVAGQRRAGTWQEPLDAQAGRPLHLTLRWLALAPPRQSQTVFIHLLDEAGRYVMGHDYTPLGGASPTYLWFPKWLPGQTFIDPYRLMLPADLPPGNYLLEVGLYGMTSLRRLPVVDSAGNLAGDRVILGPVRVE